MLTLERFCYSNEMGTFGILRNGGYFLAYTLEPPWRENQAYKSCIPCGIYDMKSYVSLRYGLTVLLSNQELSVYENISDVPREGGRFKIIFHAGNSVVDTEGCIILGNDLGFIRKKNKTYWSVRNSRATCLMVLARLRTIDQIHIGNLSDEEAGYFIDED